MIEPQHRDGTHLTPAKLRDALRLLISYVNDPAANGRAVLTLDGQHVALVTLADLELLEEQDAEQDARDVEELTRLGPGSIPSSLPNLGIESPNPAK